MDGFAAPEVAAWQGGAFTARQAVAAGLSRRQVRYRLQTGRWHRVVGHALSARPRPPEGWPAPMLAHAATLTWPDAVVGYQVAGALMGFPIPTAELLGPVRVFTRLEHDRRDGLLGHLRLALPPHIRLPAEGLLVTDLRTTAADCCGALRPDAALDLFAWLTTHGRFSGTDLGEAVRGRLGRHGVTALHRLQRRTASGAVSEAERRAHDVLRRGGITGWVTGARVHDREGLIGVVDILFPEVRVVIEIDGRRAHSEAHRFEQDRRRQNRLVLAGYIVLRYTWHQLVTDPAGVATQIRRTIEDRRIAGGR